MNRLFKKGYTLLIIFFISCFLIIGCQSSNKNEVTLTVATFNIDVKAPQNDVNEQRKLLEDVGVEIFGIQEVDHNLPRHGIAMYDPLTDFQKNRYIASIFGQSVKKGTGGYGNAIISQYQFIEKSVLPLFGTESAPKQLQQELIDIYSNFDPASKTRGNVAMMKVWGKGGLVSQGALEPRSITRVVINKADKEIAFYTTHLSVESYTIRQQQMQQLKTILDNDPIEYKIIVGDFNADEGINEFSLFTNGYKLSNGYNGVWHETVMEKDLARVAAGKGLRVKFLDNIIVSDNIDINEVYVIKTKRSDHYPLVAKLTLR